MKLHRALLVLALLVAALPASAQKQPGPATFAVRAEPIADEKAAFATVESLNVVPARARIGGTVVARPVRILSDPIFQGLALSLLFGPASSTLLTVLVVPAIDVVLSDADAVPQAN